MGQKHTCPQIAAVILAAVALFAGRHTALCQTTPDCLACHSDRSLTMKGSNGKEISVFVNSATFRKSIHGSLDCTDCHADIAEIPHPEVLKEVDCGTCHPEVQQKYRSGIHGAAARATDPDAPRCWTCHGSHDILPASDLNSSISPLNQPATCGKCHGNESFAQRHHLPAGLPSKEYENSVHAQALKKGIRRAPTCSNCHRAHSIQPASDHTSTAGTSSTRADTATEPQPGPTRGASTGRPCSRDSLPHRHASTAMANTASCRPRARKQAQTPPECPRWCASRATRPLC
jgi:hypothetical protein